VTLVEIARNTDRLTSGKSQLENFQISGSVCVEMGLVTRPEVSTAVKIQVTIFWFMTPCGDNNVSEDCTAYIFRVK